MKKILTIIVIVSLSKISFTQNNFYKFINVFPEHSWGSLPTDIVKFKLSEDTIDADTLNKYFFEIDNKIEKFVKGNEYYSVPAPHIMFTDGKFGIGAGGRFFNTTDYEEPTLIKPMARIHFNDSIVLLLIYYKNLARNYELYTLNTKTEQLLSSLRLFEKGGYNEAFCLSFINSNYKITFFKKYFVNDKEVLFYVDYKLRDDGYFQETRVVNMETSDEIIWGKVNDSDGYSNVRENPDLKSKILYKALDKKLLYLEAVPNTDWYKVLRYKEPKVGVHYREGYIHKSRVVRGRMW